MADLISPRRFIPGRPCKPKTGILSIPGTIIYLMEELKGEWQTFPAESNENGHTIIVTIRTDVDKFRDNPRFRYRVTVGWQYEGSNDEMPEEETAEAMEQVTERLSFTFQKDPVAVLTEISTGDNRREWVFYTSSLGIFNKKINESLASLPLFPLEFEAEEDDAWEIYSELL